MFEVEPTTISIISVLSAFNFGMGGEMRSMDMFDDTIFVVLGNAAVGVIGLSEVQGTTLQLLEN